MAKPKVIVSSTLSSYRENREGKKRSVDLMTSYLAICKHISEGRK